jgi:hypothetical protein
MTVDNLGQNITPLNIESKSVEDPFWEDWEEIGNQSSECASETVEVMILVHQVAVMTSYSLALLQMR